MTNKNAPLEETPEWQLARSSGATEREVTNLVAGTIRVHPAVIPDRVTSSERKAIRLPLGRYAAARAAGYDDARARDHADGQWDTRIPMDAAQADRTAAAEGLVWIPGSRRHQQRPLFPDSVSISVVDEQPPHHTLGWWYLPNVVGMLQAVP